ncbi:hypothetical protein SDC9_28971 [bioreactor metagenome]|uniref:Uncharacterized protein n=1 Tax=bioreactor metagenome TaxID=1076179 RepID=A0A644UVZ3_9ZZZZ
MPAVIPAGKGIVSGLLVRAALITGVKPGTGGVPAVMLYVSGLPVTVYANAKEREPGHTPETFAGVTTGTGLVVMVPVAVVC